MLLLMLVLLLLPLIACSKIGAVTMTSSPMKIGAQIMNAHGAGGSKVLPDDVPISFIPSRRATATAESSFLDVVEILPFLLTLTLPFLLPLPLPSVTAASPSYRPGRETL